jgi:hypothetical protein
VELVHRGLLKTILKNNNNWLAGWRTGAAFNSSIHCSLALNLQGTAAVLITGREKKLPMKYQSYHLLLMKILHKK